MCFFFFVKSKGLLKAQSIKSELQVIGPHTACSTVCGPTNEVKCKILTADYIACLILGMNHIRKQEGNVF